MAHSKKSRKPGSIGVAKSDKPKAKVQKNTPKVKKTKGNQPGSRHSAGHTTTHQVTRSKQDPRVGSKKKIDLTPVAKKTVNKPLKPKFATPAQELAALEADPRFNMLLDKVDDGGVLHGDELQFFEQSMARHKILCDLLGISEEADDTETGSDEDDPFASLDAIDINDFR
jgi:ribosome assembly protein YihI (activator of Der GTPase)